MASRLNNQRPGVEGAAEAASVWAFLGELLPVKDLTAAAQAGRLPPAVLEWQGADGRRVAAGEVVCEQIARGLFRQRQRHVLVTGPQGVGKTALVQEVARRAAGGEPEFLAGKRFMWVDCHNVGPEDSRACLETLVAAAAEEVPVVLCLDGLEALLKRPQGGTNKPLLRALAQRPGVQLVGVLPSWEYHELVGGDARMLELFSRVEVTEPAEEGAREIARQAAGELETEYQVRLPEAVVERAVVLASQFVLNAYHPQKALWILRQACEDVAYRRSQQGVEQAEVTTADVLEVVARLTGIPQETLSGEGQAGDFAALLREAVVGQEAAIEAAATELQLIKAGLTDPDQPAGVLLFAGMTGVGKTELAKRIAQLYSTSKRLQVYTMGNFTEPHSVSGIIGVPPGYVGHEHGGRLINELNADPYAVFLLDEAEKAHPNVWKPFLNLFDEGWIVDQRGVKAHADRAIFILTTNAGDQAIAQMTRAGKPAEEIVGRVKTTLAKIRQERSGQPVFTPQFLARIKRTLVFQPLDEPAMIGIARKLIAQMQARWRKKRERDLVIPEALVIWLGRRGHELNEKSGGKEGGRIVRKLISDWIEWPIQQQAMRQKVEYQRCRTIEVRIAADSADLGEAAAEPPELEIEFGS